MSDYIEDRRIDQLSPGSPVKATDQVPVFQSGDTNFITMAQFQAFIAQGVPNPPALAPYALVKRTSAYSGWYPTSNIPWQAVEGSQVSLWNNLTPTQLIVPVGTTFVRLSCSVHYAASSATSGYACQITKNGSTFFGSPYQATKGAYTGYSARSVASISAPVPCVAGDFFEVFVRGAPASLCNINTSNNTWFCMELLN